MTDTDSGQVTAWTTPTTWRTRLTHWWRNRNTRLAYQGGHRWLDDCALDHGDEPDEAQYAYPLDPATRQELAPTYWADRQLPAGPTERTGFLNTDAFRDPPTNPVEMWTPSMTAADFDTRINALINRKEARP